MGKDYPGIMILAHEVGMQAAKEAASREEEYVIIQNGIPVSVMRGLCGFASVHVKGVGAFAKFAKAHGFKKGYEKGLYLWVSLFGQSYEQKKAYATAFAQVLNSNGVEAWSSSKLD